MASLGYTRWVNAGKPYQLMRPAAALQRNIRRHGIVVYDYPDVSHLTASSPQDHTPFSVTGWPIPSAFGIAHALDIMYRTGAEGRKIALKLIADRDAGVPGVMWIKYINWTDTDGRCYQVAWKTLGSNKHTTTASNDKGHIHASGRADADNDTRAEGYDPLSASSFGGSDVGTEKATAIIEAWSQGIPETVVAGQKVSVAPVKWQLAAEKWQAGIEAVLKTIAAKVDIDITELEAIREAARLGTLEAFSEERMDKLATELARVSNKETVLIALRQFVTEGLDGPPGEA